MHNQEVPQEQEFESCSTCVETDVNRQKKATNLHSTVLEKSNRVQDIKDIIGHALRLRGRNNRST